MSRLGTFLFGATEFLRRLTGGSRGVACVGDTSSHGGTIITSGQDGTVLAAGAVVAVQGALHHCPKSGHGTTPVTPIIKNTYINGKLVVTSGAVAGCGAVMSPIERGVYAG